MAPTLGYWMIRGLAEPIRFLLWHTGTEYKEQLYEVTGEPGNWSRDEWLQVKKVIDLDFPNLPYYMDGKTKITETRAILEHIARKHNLVGKSEEDYIWISMCYGVIIDIYNGFGHMCYNPDYETLKGPYMEKLPTIVAKIAKVLKGDYICGKELTYVDFLLFETLERWLVFCPTLLQGQPGLEAFHQRMAALPGVVAYRASPIGLKVKARLNNPMAAFNGL